MAEIDGATVIARSLRQQGVDYLFGIVGFPVIPVAVAAQREGIQYIGMRNEQAASYAAGAVGYLTRRPGACLAVSGPGMVHAIAGLANAQANCWPMILLGGANDSFQDGRGAFQEAPQVEAARPFVKYAARPDRLERVPFYIEQAVRKSLYGRPGATYVDLPNDIIVGRVDEARMMWPPQCPEPPRTVAEPQAIGAALSALKSAERPLVIVGKGAAYARAESEIRDFIERTQLPFLPTPMGKGVIPDDHPLSVAPARSTALQEADVVFLMGARLNWILHFGLPPRFNKDVRVIQLDVAAEEIGTNVPAEVALVGDAQAITWQLNAALDREPWTYPGETTWWNTLRAAIAENSESVWAMEQDDAEPIGYYRVLRAIREALPRDAIIVSEGANTMDISRTVLPNFQPRSRLDAGSFGTMGVGPGQAIAAAVVHPDRKVVAVEGDSAFGFSGMEFEVAMRYGLPITFIVLNNNAMYGAATSQGVPEGHLPPGGYMPNLHYEKIAEVCGAKGYFVTRVDELDGVLAEAIADPRPNIVNVMIDPHAQRKRQKYAWLTR